MNMKSLIVGALFAMVSNEVCKFCDTFLLVKKNGRNLALFVSCPKSVEFSALVNVLKMCHHFSSLSLALALFLFEPHI